MERRGDGTLRAVQQLLMSGIGGQLRFGDTLGIWTYNNELHAGRFPLQHWRPETQRSTIQNALAFLQSQTCEKQGNLSVIIPAMQTLLKNSPLLTVILVSDGEQKIQGTPFDDQINKLYGSWVNEQQKSKMPIITVLRGSQGRWTDFSVNAAPWPVEMPPLPQIPIAETVLPPPPAPKPSPPRGTNLFVSGRKTEKRKIDAPATNTLPINSPQPAPNSSSALESTLVTQPPLVTAQPIASQVVASRLANTDPPTRVAATESGSIPTSAGSQPETPKPSSSAAAQIPSKETRLTPSIPREKEAEPAPIKKNPASDGLQTQSVSAAKVQDPVPVEKQPIDKNEQENESSVVERSRTATPAPIVAVVPRSSPKGILVVAGSITLLAGVLLFFYARRSRTTKDVSLITRSLNRKNQ